MLVEGHRCLRKRGFSLFEIVGVVTIMVILMTMLAIGVGGFMPLSRSKDANTDIIRIQQALEKYKLKFGEYPKKVDVEGSAQPMGKILFNALAGTLAPNGKLGNFPSLLDRGSLEFANESFPIVGDPPALVDNAIVDPWGNAYQYRYDPDDSSWENFTYVLFSAGPDTVFTEVTVEGQKNAGALNNNDNIYAQ